MGRKEGRMLLKKLAIMTDSASDLSQELQEKYKLTIVSLTVASDGKSYEERKDLTPQQYYEILRTAKEMPVTAQVTPFAFHEAYMAHAKQGVTDLIVVTINAGASGTNASAHVAEEQFRQEFPESGMRIHIVDSASYSMAYGYHVCKAAEKIAAGASLEEVLEYLRSTFASMQIAIAPYTLRYIQKSGRISAATAFAGGVLGLRPIISLVHGESVVQSKVRGDKSVAPALCGYFAEHMEKGTPYLVGTTDMERGRMIAAMCEELAGYPPEEIFWLGCCVTTNTGPDADGIVYSGRAAKNG